MLFLAVLLSAARKRACLPLLWAVTNYQVFFLFITFNLEFFHNFPPSTMMIVLLSRAKPVFTKGSIKVERFRDFFFLYIFSKSCRLSVFEVESQPNWDLKNTVIHTVSSQNFWSFLFSYFFLNCEGQFSTLHIFFVKLQCSVLKTFISFNNFLKFFLLLMFLRKPLIATYGARVPGSVFKMEFTVLTREFESINTFPGFAWLLWENWV